MDAAGVHYSPWLDANSVIHGGPDALLAAEISFCGLDRYVAKQELYLLQFASRCVAKLRAGPSQVMRCRLVDGILDRQTMMQKFEVVDR